MKKTAKLLCALLALCLLLAFAACKKNQPATTELPKDTATIYYLSGVSYSETVYTLDQLQIADPAQCYIFFDLGGTGILCIDGWETFFEYEHGQLWDEIDPETKVNYSVSGDALTLEQDGYKMVFTQGELPEWAQPQEEEVEMLPDETPVEEVPAN